MIETAVMATDRHRASADRLVGYVVGKTEAVPTNSELRAYLGRRLPDHKVPSLFVPVTDFERTATGKVDRGALPTTNMDIHAHRIGDVVEPANPIEAALKEIWEDLLGGEGVSVEEGIGGDTLPDSRIEDMANHCIDLMRQVRPNGPYRIMEHSAAGLVAFEIAQRLQAQGVDVSKLILLDSDLPGSASRLANHVWRKPVKALRFAGSLARQALGIAGSGGPVALHAARRGAWYRYRPRPYAGDCLLITSAAREQSADLVNGWRQLITGRLVDQEVPGDHSSMLLEPDVGHLAAVINQTLAD